MNWNSAFRRPSQSGRKKSAAQAGLVCLIASLAWQVLCSEAVLAGEPPITAAVFTPGGAQLVIGSQSGLSVLSWPSLDVVRTIPTELVHIHDLAFSLDGRRLAAAGGLPAEDGILELYHWPSARRLGHRRLHDDLIMSIAALPQGQWAVASADRLVQRLDADGHRLNDLRGHSHPVLAVVSLPKQNLLVTAGIDQSLRVWDPSTGKVHRTLANHTAPVLDLAVQPEQNGALHPYVASISEDRTVRIWQPTIGRMVRFARLGDVPLAVDWTHDGTRIVVGCRDGQVRLIDPTTVQVLAEVPVMEGWIHTVAAHPKEQAVFVGGTHGVRRRIELKRDK